MVELLDKFLIISGSGFPKSVLDSFEKTLSEADFEVPAKNTRAFPHGHPC